jgi:allantoate deiminase
MQLAKIGQTKDGGVTRPSLTPEYLKAQARVIKWMEEAGLTTRIDATGNLIGRREGRETGAPAIILGSHIDTVINGGKFDGTVGVLGGIEVAQCIQDNNISPYHALEVVSFIEEESTRWPISTLGSHAMSGQIDPEKVLPMPDRQGIKIQDALKGVGIDPNNILHAKREPKEIAAYLELHIEQGAVLDNLNLPVGVVTGIAAQVILELTLKGRTDHAGATPMHIRKDALIGAAQIVLEVQKLAIQAGPDSVATVGRMEVKPGALNAVPGEVFMTFDIRDIHLETRDNLVRQIVLMIHSIAKINHLELNLIETSRLTPVMLPEKMINTISESCRKLHIPVHIMPSGASHDAQNMAKITDVGMIFIRSKNGISHSPEEFSTMDDISLGTSVLYETVLKLDGEIKV